MQLKDAEIIYFKNENKRILFVYFLKKSRTPVNLARDMYALVFVFALFASVVVALREGGCSKALEMALFRPRMCLTNYFKSLTCEFNKQAQYYLSADPFRTATFCLRFSEENQVGLSIIDSQGINLCILNNPTAFKMAQIGQELDLRSAANRYAIYQYYDPQLVGVPHLPPPGDENVDIVGLYYIYRNISLTLNPVKNQSVIPYIDTVLEYIRNYPVSGPQYNVDLQYNAIFATITASIPTSQAKEKLTILMNTIASIDNVQIEFNDIASASFDTVVFLIVLLRVATGNLANPLFLNTLSERIIRYQRIRMILLEGTGAASIQQSFAQPLPINTRGEGLCYYSYNINLPTGNLVRIVFSQTNLLGK